MLLPALCLSVNAVLLPSRVGAWFLHGPTRDLLLQSSLQKQLLVLQGHLPFLLKGGFAIIALDDMKNHDYNIRNNYH